CHATGVLCRDARQVAGTRRQLEDGSAGQTGAPLLEIGLEPRPFRQPSHPHLVGWRAAAGCFPPVVLHRRPGAVVRELLLEHPRPPARSRSGHTVSLAVAATSRRRDFSDGHRSTLVRSSPRTISPVNCAAATARQSSAWSGAIGGT